MDLYQVLGVPPSATPDDIKRAHRALVRTVHPDKSGGDEGRFLEVQKAYEVLSDPAKRELYDCGGGEDEEVILPRKDPMEELFDEIFLRGELLQGPDVTIPICVSLEDIYCGRRKRVSFRRYEYDGSRQLYSTKISLNSPLQVIPGEADRFPGHTVGDLVIEITSAPHPRFQRQGVDLVTSYHIPLIEVYYDHYFTIMHLDGQPLHLKCPAGSLLRSTRLCAKGYGLPSPPDQANGNLLIDFKIDLPPNLEALKQCERPIREVPKNKMAISVQLL